MNNRDTIIAIIEEHNGAAAFEDICFAYRDRYHMVIFPEHRSVIERTLKNAGLTYNKLTGKWSISDIGNGYLTVSEMKYFQSNRDAMKQIFNKSVDSGSGFFDIDDKHTVWFPKFNHKEWDNVFSGDGKQWKYKPKVGTFEFDEDERLRFIFVKDKGTAECRFTGVFEYVGENAEGYRVFNIVDDKVEMVKPRPALIVCRIANMKYYNGITEDDIPENGGSFVDENNDAGEKYNFHKYEDGYCYGFVETGYKSGHTGEDEYAKSTAIEKIDINGKEKDCIDNVRVVFMTLDSITNTNVVVGWYDNATVYRNRVVDGDKTYMMKCLSTDAHLIPYNRRNFKVPHSREKDATFGIGQNNFWYIQTVPEAEQYEQELVDYINGFPDK